MLFFLHLIVFYHTNNEYVIISLSDFRLFHSTYDIICKSIEIRHYMYKIVKLMYATYFLTFFCLQIG